MEASTSRSQEPMVGGPWDVCPPRVSCRVPARTMGGPSHGRAEWSLGRCRWASGRDQRSPFCPTGSDTPTISALLDAVVNPQAPAWRPWCDASRPPTPTPWGRYGGLAARRGWQVAGPSGNRPGATPEDGPASAERRGCGKRRRMADIKGCSPSHEDLGAGKAAH